MLKKVLLTGLNVKKEIMLSLNGRFFKIKILLFHNTLWAHYKAAVFSDLAKLCVSSGHNLKVVHVAQTESTRKGLVR